MNQTTKECRLGIIGAGRIGKLHAENIKHRLPQFNLMAISDPKLDQDWAKSMQIPLIDLTADALITHPDLDAVLIASPSDCHVKHIIAASRAGKAIFCEKPIGLAEAEIISACQEVESNNTLLQIGFNRRFDPSFATLRARVQNGDIGTPQVVKITSRDPACPPKGYVETSGGIFMDMTIHDFDMARFLTFSEVVEVYAAGSVLISPEFEAFHDVDTAIVQMRFANGALGVIDNSRQALYGYDQRIEVFGSAGMLRAENQLENTVTHYSSRQVDQAKPKYFFLERYEQAFVAELSAFYDAWANQKPSPVSSWDGLQAVRIAMAAKQSLETNLPVSIQRDYS
jgi:myo-inositol 2-dehydrogenase/D-chiro-inositol 1-dehydrogenase